MRVGEPSRLYPFQLPPCRGSKAGDFFSPRGARRLFSLRGCGCPSYLLYSVMIL